MAIARVAGQTETIGESSSAASVGTVLNQNIVAGNFVIACGPYRQTFTSMVDGLGNNYVTDSNFTHAPGDRQAIITSCKKVTVPGACTITFTQSSAARIACFAMEYSGFGSGGAQLEDTATNFSDTTTTSRASGAADLASSEGLAIMCSMDGAFGVPYTYGSSFATLGESDGTIGRGSSGDRILSASGNYEGTATVSDTGDTYCATLALYGPVPVDNNYGFTGGNSDELITRRWL
jgi:hypothetical protein